jgi:hypothetical protein
MGESGDTVALAAGATATGFGGGKVVQVVNVMDGAVATGTTILPSPPDNTIPQITEGDEYMTLAITPANASNKLKIEVVVIAGSSVAGWMGVALFQDATSDALGWNGAYDETATAFSSMPFTHYMTAGTVSSTTFRVRVGGKSAGTTTFNGQNGSRIAGGVASSSITITEISV